MKKLLMVVLVVATWKASWQEPVPCEINKPTVNKFTGELEFSGTTYAVYCEETKTKDMRQEFPSVEAARQFFADCDKALGVRCSNRNIEEIHE